MELLKQRILTDGKVREGNVLKVNSFLNHQVDIDFVSEIGKEFFRLFDGKGVTKILTIEASGIAIAAITAGYFHVPLLFAKKSSSKNLDGDVYVADIESYTHGNTYTAVLERQFLTSADRVLIIDDFLATGNAQRGLLDITAQSGAAVAGIGIVIEKGFQGGGDALRAEGYPLQSLAIIDSMAPGRIVFRG